MKINSKLLLSFSVMALLATTAGYLSFSQISKVSGSFDIVQNESTPMIVALGNIKSDLNGLQAAVLAFNLHVPEAATDPEAKQLAADHLEETQMQKESLMKSYATYASLEQDKVAADKIGTRINKLITLTDEMIARGSMIMEEEVSADHSVPDSSFEHLHGLVLQFVDEGMIFTEDLNMKIADEQKALELTQVNVLNDIQGGINLTMVLTVGGVVVVFVVGGLAAYSITRRVSQLKAEANKVAAGDLTQQIATSGSDEITDLASNFEHMRKILVNAQDALASKNKELQILNVSLEQANEQLEVANEALKKLDKLKDQFIGVASHELRGPIHPILGYAAMAKSGKLEPLAAIDVIYNQALRLKQLASDILDVSKIESGNLSYNMQKVKIHEILLNALIAASGTVNPSKISINARIDEANKELEIVADKDRIEQVFSNIIGNAAKFTKKGSITGETHINVNSNYVEILISDTGGGIPEDVLPNLFGKFITKNVGGSNKEGSGLGLYISKAIITAHGGTIEAFNDNGGATFRIVLPINNKSVVTAEMARNKGS